MNRILIEFYRSFLYILFNKNNKSALKILTSCQVLKKGELIYFGDIVHPCIRYSKNKFLAYNWWMVYTPYYNNNPKIENPILCYGIDEGNGNPPSNWEFYSHIVSEPIEGYNSDPNMYFNDTGLNIFWRENITSRTKIDNCYRATYGLKINFKGEIINYEKPILTENRRYFDNEVSASFFEKNNYIYAYAMTLRFKNKSWIFKYSFLNKISSKLISLFSLLEFKSHIKSYGISVWKGDNFEKPFKLIRNIEFKNLNKLYKPWHLDTFDVNGKTYAIIQTNKSNADICLAYYSDELGVFHLYPKPLITSRSINKLGVYKATGFVFNDVFYLYFTAQELNNRKLNKLFFSEYVFKDLIANIS